MNDQMHEKSETIDVILQEMRTRRVNNRKQTSPTLIAWADRIEAAWSRHTATKSDADWMNHRKTVEAMRLWNAVAEALGTDKYDPDAVLAAAKAKSAAVVKDAARYRFCVTHNVFPVRDQGGEQWVMFVAVKSNCRSLFISDTPTDAIDAAIAAAGGWK